MKNFTDTALNALTADELFELTQDAANFSAAASNYDYDVALCVMVDELANAGMLHLGSYDLYKACQAHARRNNATDCYAQLLSSGDIRICCEVNYYDGWEEWYKVTYEQTYHFNGTMWVNTLA